MPLPSFISLSTNNPHYYGYDASNPTAPYGYGTLKTYGGHASGTYWGIGGQASRDETLLRYSPSDPTVKTIGSLATGIYEKSSVGLYLDGFNTPPEGQYLIVLGLRHYSGSVTAQIFVNTDLVREEPLTGTEQIAILTDNPGTGIFVYVRVASDNYYAGMIFEGAEVYLL